MADALNERIHGEMTDSDAPTVTAARGHRITVGDLIISRRNDPTVTVPTGGAPQPADPVRNGNRWRVYAVDAKRHRIAAHRLDDGAAVVFSGEYLRDHVTDGYAVTCTPPKAPRQTPPTPSSAKAPRGQSCTSPLPMGATEHRPSL